MISWDNYKYLLAIHRHSTMSKAADSLGTNVATVSRRIDKLNELLGMPCLIKRPDGWDVNPRLHRILTAVEEFNSSIECELNNLHTKSGTHKTSISIGAQPAINNKLFYPGLTTHLSPPDGVILNFSNRVTAEGMGDDDIIVSMTRPEGGRVITRRAGSIPYRLYMAKGDEVPEGWIGLNQTFDTHGVITMGYDYFGGPPVVRVQHFHDIEQVIQSRHLAGPLPCIHGAYANALVPIPDSPVYNIEYWLTYHATRKGDDTLRETSNWIVRCFKNEEQKRERAASAENAILPLHKSG
ncbi:hypothetical protein ATO2_01450 [Roseovarius sp. 22II1-1F6A]|mgnify:FL=1|nr:LysR family transcriptional regulator [Actibacterium sp.]OWU71996.1 hypothetical protein ATO2_01450 [Roseovarius sp. 22II1-1F6A]